MRCLLLFVVQRGDVTQFEISLRDPIYRDAVREAIRDGVQVHCIRVSWDGHHHHLERPAGRGRSSVVSDPDPPGAVARFGGALPIVWDDASSKE